MSRLGYGYTRPKDWDCNACGNTGNFGTRDRCRRCGVGKYDKTSTKKDKNQAGRPGDWVCPGCDFLCYASKTECSKCKIKKVDVLNGTIDSNNPNEPTNEPTKREGDWDCDKCGKFQFARNKFCRDCGNPKDGDVVIVDTGDTGDGDDNDITECVVCMDAASNTMLLHGDTGHTCVCESCAVILVGNDSNCPMCRQSIDKYVRNFQ